MYSIAAANHAFEIDDGGEIRPLTDGLLTIRFLSWRRFSNPLNRSIPVYSSFSGWHSS
jgi:hypothetical protein